MKGMSLEQIAAICLGTAFRSRLIMSAVGDIRVVQMKNLTESSGIDIENAARIEGTDELKEQHQLRVGDILFRSRGLNTTAMLLTENPERTIVSSPIFIIRARLEFTIPEYLVWWINQPASQAYFRSRSEGSLDKMVSKKTLANLKVVLPSIEKQKCIADFYDLAMREQTLLSLIKMKRRRYAHGIMRQMALDSDRIGWSE